MIKLNRDKSLPKMTSVGIWRPSEGVNLFDVLFPHASNGFRNKNMHIVTYHVSAKDMTKLDRKAQLLNNVICIFRILHGKSSNTTIRVCQEKSKGSSLISLTPCRRS